MYNLSDQKTHKKIIDLNICEIPNLHFIQSLISKIQLSKQSNEVEEFQLLQTQLQEQIENIDVKRDVLGITVKYEDY